MGVAALTPAPGSTVWGPFGGFVSVVGTAVFPVSGMTAVNPPPMTIFPSDWIASA